MVLMLIMAAAIGGGIAPARSVVTGEELAATALRAARANEPDEVKLSVPSIPPDLPIPIGQRELSALPAGESGRSDRHLQRLAIRVDGRLVAVVAVPLRRSAPGPGWVYVEDHAAATPAGRIGLQPSIVDFASGPQLAPEGFQPPSATRLRRHVRAGAAVRVDDFEAQPAVARRAEIMVHGEAKGVRVSRLAVALEDAQPGDAARVRVGDRVLRAHVLATEDAPNVP